MCYFCTQDGWMDGGIKGPSLNNCSSCLVWKPRLLGCLRRRGAAFVDMSEQTVLLLLAEELKREWICKDRTGTANGCQSAQRMEKSVSLKAWGHKLLGTGGTQAVLGSSPSGRHPARRVDDLPGKPCPASPPGDPRTPPQREPAIEVVAEERHHLKGLCWPRKVHLLELMLTEMRMYNKQMNTATCSVLKPMLDNLTRSLLMKRKALHFLSIHWTIPTLWKWCLLFK